MTTTAQATSAARRLARLAAVRRSGLTSCPYPPTATGTASAARRAWIGEYGRLRPADLPAVDYGDKVSALAEGPDTGDDGAPATVQPDLFAEAGQ
jgi:hypothetical protein